MSMAVQQNTQRQTTHVKHDLKVWMSAFLHPPCLQIDLSLTSRYPAPSNLETEPHCHHRLPIPHRIANADRQGFQWGKACCTSAKAVLD